MGRREPAWDELRTFLQVVRGGSLSGAARRLGLTQPTVGRHIDALEQALGVTLFTRSPRGLTPTPAAIAPAIRASRSNSRSPTAMRISRAATPTLRCA